MPAQSIDIYHVHGITLFILTLTTFFAQIYRFDFHRSFLFHWRLPGYINNNSAQDDCIQLLSTPSHLTSRLLVRGQPLRGCDVQLIYPWIHLPDAHLRNMRNSSSLHLQHNKSLLSRRWRNRYPIYYVLPVHAYLRSRGRAVI